MSKIFSIGLPKTGNTSMFFLLTKAGLKGVQYPNPRQWCNLSTYDFAVDTPCNVYYEDLHNIFPNSKFVLTIRDEESWLKSWNNHKCNYTPKTFWEATNRRMLENIFGSVQQHQEQVQDIIPSKQLFVFNINDKDTKGLCEFLNIPYMEFPHKNASS